MSRSLCLTAAIFLAVAGAIGAAPLAGHAEGSVCAGDKVDGSTADMARKKIAAAGYRHIRDLKKGCDNFWHGQAEKDGQTVNVVLSPKGDIETEGN